MKTLDELAEVKRGKSRHRPRTAAKLYGGPHPFIQTADIHASGFRILSHSQTYSDFGLAQSKKWKAGTLCVTNAGEDTGDCAILGFDAFFPDSIIGITPREGKSDVRFLKYSLDLLKPQLRTVTKGATQDNLSVAILLSFPFPAPSLPTQRKIAGILSTYDDLIENNLRRIKILEEMAQSLYREWFVHFRFPGHESVKFVDSALGKIPEEWEAQPVGYFGKVITGKTPSKASANFFGEDVPFVKTPDMHGNMFLIEVNEKLSTEGADSQANKTLPTGSICVSCIGTIGVVCITTEACQTNQQINSIALSDKKNVEFLYFRLLDAKQTLENIGSNGATMGNVNKSKFESLEIVCPPPGLIGSYHDFVSPIFAEILVLIRRNQNLRQTRDLLLPKLLSNGDTLFETGKSSQTLQVSRRNS